MKKLLFAMTVATFSVAFFGYSLLTTNRSGELMMANVESMAQGESGVILCHCAKSQFLTNNGCYADNSGNTCAQSASGGNIICSTFNGNCH